MTTAMQGNPKPIGLVLIGTGSVLFILGMREKYNEEKKPPRD